ncbi:hypothetical protein JCM10212_002069 [Sporobolomyces blumeae]
MRLLHLVATIAVLIDRAHAGDIAITVDQSVTKGGTLDLRWTSDSPTYTVRILLNKHEYKEEKSIAEAEYHWQAEDVKVGDKVQIWVYDSAGNSGKTAFLPVVEGFPEQDDSMSSGTGTWTAPGTNTRTSDHTPVGSVYLNFRKRSVECCCYFGTRGERICDNVCYNKCRHHLDNVGKLHRRG